MYHAPIQLHGGLEEIWETSFIIFSDLSDLCENRSIRRKTTSPCLPNQPRCCPSEMHYHPPNWFLSLRAGHTICSQLLSYCWCCAGINGKRVHMAKIILTDGSAYRWCKGRLKRECFLVFRKPYTAPEMLPHAVGGLILTLVLSLSLFESERIFRVLGEKNSSVFSLPEKDKTTFVALGGQRPGGEGSTSWSTPPPPPVAEEK